MSTKYSIDIEVFVEMVEYGIFSWDLGVEVEVGMG